MEKKSRLKIARRVLLFWTLFIGLGALAGGVGMIADPSGKAMGMDAMLPYFQVLPFAEVLFRDLFFSGIALIVVNGVTNLTAAALLLAKKKSGIILGGIFGVTLMLWICIQFYMFPLNFMSTIYFVFGSCQAIAGYAAWVFERQERFVFDPSDYKNVGTNDKRLVVYFSRMGYVKKLAYEVADQTGARLYEIVAKERTQSTAGFWWCGRFAMHRWAMPIEPIDIDLSAYEHVTVCTPVWAFALSSPVRAFCRQARGKIKEADYICVHYARGRYENVAREMDSLLGVLHTDYLSVRCRTGRYQAERGEKS